MSAKKEIKRAIKSVWAEVKALKAEHGKSYEVATIHDAAKKLRTSADRLEDLGKKLSALSTTPAAPDNEHEAGKAPSKGRRKKSPKSLNEK